VPDLLPTALPRPRRYVRRRIALSCATFLTLVAAGVAAPAIARSQPVACPRATATTVVAAGIPYADWAENLGYDAQGELWVSRLYRNQVQRYDRTGRVTASVTVSSPGAIRLGPDRLLYVVYGDNSTNVLPGGHDSGVVRFDPTAAAPRPETFVRGLTMANGAAFDDAGNLYVADTGSGVIRVRRDATIDPAWTAQTKVFGVNGLAVEGDSVYTTVYLTGHGRVLRIPIAAPSRRYSVADLGLADDLAVGPGGFLYVATTSGHLVRVDPGGHGTCTLLGAGPKTAVTTDSHRDLMVATGRGDVLRVQLDS
jgi:virginiamycin B lyase